MRQIERQQEINKGKLSLLAIALSGALSAMAPAHAQTTLTTTQTWSSGDILNDSSTIISVSGGTAAVASGTLGTVTNDGVIHSGITALYSNGTISTLNNTGTISGAVKAFFNTGTITVMDNSGTIDGATNTAIQNLGIIDLLSNSNLITGNTAISNGGTIHTLTNDSTIGGNTGISNGGLIGLLSNSGSISGISNGATINTLTNSGNISGNINGNNAAVSNGGNIALLTNSGTISSSTSAIYNDTGATISSISNLTGGTISGDMYGVNNSGLISTLSNSASGLISGASTGILNAGTIGTLNNSGTITGANLGIKNDLGKSITALNNSGLIQGTNQGILNRGIIGTLSNNSTGVISGQAAGLVNSVIITIVNNSGAISGASYGIYNNGTIGLLANSGTIKATRTSTGNAYGLYNSVSIGTLNNSGLIAGQLAAIDLTASGTLSNFINTGTIAGAIINDSSSDLNISGGSGTTFGTLTGYSGGVTASDIGSIISATNVNFTSGNQLLNDNITVNAGVGTVTNSGVLQLLNPVTITGNYVQDSSASLLIGVTSSTTFNGNLTDTGYGRLVVNGDAVIASGSSITLKSLGYSFAQGQRYVVIAANGSGTNYNAGSLVYSATGYSVTGAVQVDSSNAAYSDLVLTLASTSTGSTTPINHATTSNAIAALGGLLKYSGTDASLLAVFNPATGFDSSAAANKAGAELSPAAVSNATVQAVNASNQAVTNVVISHIDGIRLAQSGTNGVATGERTADIGLWGQVFGGRASQDLRDNISGYHANYRGLLIGADGLVSDNLRVGGLVSAAKTNLASDDDNTGSSADVNNYGLTAYATYTGSPWYVHVMAGASRQQYSTTRAISYSTFSGTTNGSFHGSQYLTSVQAGYPLNVGAWLPETTLTPIAGLSYSTLRQNGYTETGGNGAALVVNAATSNSLKSELGTKLESRYDVSYGKLLPSVQLGWRHEYRDDALQTGASFAADSTGATSFVTQGTTPVANLAVLNLGLTLLQSSRLSLTGKYTLETGGGYMAQTGSVQVRWQY